MILITGQCSCGLVRFEIKSEPFLHTYTKLSIDSFAAGFLLRRGKVIHHIWVGSKAGWDVIGDHGKQHLEAYSG